MLQRVPLAQCTRASGVLAGDMARVNSPPTNRRTCFQYVVVRVPNMDDLFTLPQGKFVDDNMVHGTYLLENGDEYEVSVVLAMD